MIQAVTCLLFPLVGGCGPFVDYAATVSDITRHPAYYASRPLVVTGDVHGLNQFRGASFGTAAETFSLCAGRCVSVFMREHTPIYDGERVSVRGVFSITRRIGKYVFHDNVEATEIFARS